MERPRSESRPMMLRMNSADKKGAYALDKPVGSAQTEVSVEDTLSQEISLNKRKKKDGNRFKIMFFLTGGFFVAEVVTAIMTGSLAMMSDAMHMLSDTMALCIGFYALMSSQKEETADMTYGYSRAEVIGALINAASLMAICFTILIEALERFMHREELEGIDNVGLLLGVGIAGLIVNIGGMFIFGHGHSHGLGGGDDHGHGHSHGGGGHGHGHKSHAHSHSDTDDSKNQIELVESGHGHTHGDKPCHGHGNKKDGNEKGGHGHSHEKGSGHGHSHGDKPCHGHGHKKEGHGHTHKKDGHGHTHGGKPCTGHGKKKTPAKAEASVEDEGRQQVPKIAGLSDPPRQPSHASPRKPGDLEIVGEEDPETQIYRANRSNSLAAVQKEKEDFHPEMNMNVHGVFLHVMGDALGSVGVIISACLIKFTDWEYRFYADPICSVVLVIIISFSTFPLLKQSIRILMHRVPSNLDMPSIQRAILQTQGVLDVHDVHCWALSPGAPVGTAHVIVNNRVDSQTTLDTVKEILHLRGIHSSVIQIETARDDNWKVGSSPCYDLVCSKDKGVKMCCARKRLHPPTQSGLARKMTPRTDAPNVDAFDLRNETGPKPRGQTTESKDPTKIPGIRFRKTETGLELLL